MLSILFVFFFGLVFFVCFWSSFCEIITFFTYIKLSKHSISVALFWYIWIFKVYSQYHLTFINLCIVFFLQWRVHLDGIKMKIWFPSQSLSWSFRAQHLKNFVRVFKPLSTKSG